MKQETQTIPRSTFISNIETGSPGILLPARYKNASWDTKEIKQVREQTEK